MTTVLKLGGSVITRKDEPEAVDDSALDSAATVLGRATPDELVVVHGGGSFGHHHAAAHGVSTADGTHDTDAVADIHGAMKRLNGHVLDALRGAGVPAVPVHPLSLCHRDEDGALSVPTGAVETLVGEGFVPVLHGDLVAHAGAGTTVVSGDELVTSLAAGLSATRIGMCSTVPGVLDADDEVIPAIESYDEVSNVLGESASTDVTGGMAAKVRALLELGTPSFVFGPDSLDAFVAGEDAGTRIDGH